MANHGIPASLVADYFDQLRRLFELPLEEKMALLADDNNRGYTPLHVRGQQGQHIATHTRRHCYL